MSKCGLTNVQTHRLQNANEIWTSFLHLSINTDPIVSVEVSINPSPIHRTHRQRVIRQSSHMISTDFKGDSVLKEELSLLRSLVDEFGSGHKADDNRGHKAEDNRGHANAKHPATGTVLGVGFLITGFPNDILSLVNRVVNIIGKNLLCFYIFKIKLYYFFRLKHVLLR